MDEFWVKAVDILLPVLQIAILALIGVGIQYLKSKADAIKHDTLQQAYLDALAEAQVVATDAVKATMQTFVTDLKEKAQNGKLTDEEKREALRRAKEYFFSHMSTNSLNILESATVPIKDWLEDFIEARVFDEKASLPK